MVKIITKSGYSVFVYTKKSQLFSDWDSLKIEIEKLKNISTKKESSLISFQASLICPLLSCFFDVKQMVGKVF